MEMVVKNGKRVDVETGEILEDAAEDMAVRHEELNTVKVYGECKYCHQIRRLEFNEEVSQEYANEQATRLCDCEEAKAEQWMEEKKERIMDNLERKLKKFSNPNVARWIREGIDLVSELDIDKFSLNIAEKVIGVSINAKGNIKANYKETKTESLEN